MNSDQTLAKAQIGYYQELIFLSPKAEAATGQITKSAVTDTAPVPVLAPYMMYLPFVVFFLLFIGVFAMQIVNKVKSARQIMMAFLFALVTAGTPFIVTMLNMGIVFQAKAGPDEIPRNIRIISQSPESLRVIWSTDAKKIGSVKVKDMSHTPYTERIIIGNFGEQVQDHLVNIDGVPRGASYEMEIFSGTTWYDNQGKPIQIQLK